MRSPPPVRPPLRLALPLLSAALFLAVGVARPVRAQGSVTFSIQQVGSNVVVTAGGVFDLTGATSKGCCALEGGFVTPSTPAVVVGPNGGQDNVYLLTSSAGPFGTGGYKGASSGTGSIFGLNGDFGGVVSLPTTFTGGAISGTATFSGQTFATLGLTPGVYRYALPNTTITVDVGVVPEPTTWALVGLGLLAVGGVAHRRRVPVA